MREKLSFFLPGRGSMCEEVDRYRLADDSRESLCVEIGAEVFFTMPTSDIDDVTDPTLTLDRDTVDHLWPKIEPLCRETPSGTVILSDEEPLCDSERSAWQLLVRFVRGEVGL